MKVNIFISIKRAVLSVNFGGKIAKMQKKS